MSLILFHYADVKNVPLKNKNLVKQQVANIFSNEEIELRKVIYIFCSDEYLLEINKSFLQHDYYTDIITFDLSEGEGILGEVYISVDRVKENAISHITTFKRELLRVIFHGALHLCGYKDKKKSEITIMREKEEYNLLQMEKKLQ